MIYNISKNANCGKKSNPLNKIQFFYLFKIFHTYNAVIIDVTSLLITHVHRNLFLVSVINNKNSHIVLILFNRDKHFEILKALR